MIMNIGNHAAFTIPGVEASINASASLTQFAAVYIPTPRLPMPVSGQDVYLSDSVTNILDVLLFVLTLYLD